jgi:hypothetical protein
MTLIVELAVLPIPYSILSPPPSSSSSLLQIMTIDLVSFLSASRDQELLLNENTVNEFSSR